MSVSNFPSLKRFKSSGFRNNPPKLSRVLFIAAILLGTTTVLFAQDVVSPGSTDTNRATPPATSVAPPKVNVEDYIISPDDELEIYVLDVTELSRIYSVSKRVLLFFSVVGKSLL